MQEHAALHEKKQSAASQLSATTSSHSPTPARSLLGESKSCRERHGTGAMLKETQSGL
jgi:hypothetical protein